MEVLPKTLFVSDAWHHSQSQFREISLFVVVMKMNIAAWKRMEYDIALLRRSETADIFLARSDDVEGACFRNANTTKGISFPAQCSKGHRSFTTRTIRIWTR